MRTSTLRSTPSPRRRNSPFSRTRRNFFCTPGPISQTSSMNIVPRSASSKRPRRSVVAPVNAPFMWPNSSFSRSVSWSAPQLIATSGRSARGERFARAALAEDQDRRRRRGDALDHGEHVAHGLARADDVRRRLAALQHVAEALVLRREPALLERLLEDHRQLADLERFLEVV